jgi:hypothetical protein
MSDDHRARLVHVPLFEGFMLRADEGERSALRLIAHEKPRRDDIRAHPRPSMAAQLLDLFECMAELDVDLEGRARARVDADKLRSWIISHETVEDHNDPHVQYQRAVLAIDAVMARMVGDQHVTFSGILFDDQLPERSVILPELVRDAAVFWQGDDNACLRCSTTAYTYLFRNVMTKITDQNGTSSWPTGVKRKMPAEVLDRRMQRMAELYGPGMDRTAAARQAIAEIPHRDHSLGGAVKCLLRTWAERWPQAADCAPNRKLRRTAVTRLK